MVEEVLVTARFNPKIDPSLSIWTWEISVYLFLGGLTAGIMCFAAGVVLLGREREAPFAAHRLALWAPVVGVTTVWSKNWVDPKFRPPDLPSALTDWRKYPA